MKWLWKKSPQEPCGRPTDEATHAAKEAQRGRRDVENLAGRVDQVAKELSKTRERNHFAAAVIAAIRGA